MDYSTHVNHVKEKGNGVLGLARAAMRLNFEDLPCLPIFCGVDGTTRVSTEPSGPRRRFSCVSYFKVPSFFFFRFHFLLLAR